MDMSAAGLTLVARAEASLARLRQAREVQQDQAARARVRIVAERAVAARTALEAVREALLMLEPFAVRPGALPGNLVTDGRKAKTDLRQAATTSLRGEGVRRIERLTGQSVNEALRTAENL